MSFSSDIVIGLEIHVELSTDSKLFCGCKRAADPDEIPNSRTCPVCLGHPGAKPVLNKKAVEFALKLAAATQSDINDELVFSRKSYFYPDLAKNYQISQYEIPLAENGKIRLSSGKEINLTRIHIEEDPASLVHPNGTHNSGYVLVDYNRSGDPLCEVVTEPELASPKEARDFMKQLITLLNYLKIFDPDTCIIKADANISIKESGYVRSEIKNITGFKEIERALEYELKRQKHAASEGRRFIQDTRAWDPLKGITRQMRVKETEDDYGYIIDPDLVVIDITEEWVRDIHSGLPELPSDKIRRYVDDLKISQDDASVIASDPELAGMYERVAEKIDPVLAARWLRRELARVMNYNDIGFSDLQITSDHLIELLDLVQKKKITDNVAQKILEKLAEKPFSVSDYVKKEGLEAVSDTGELEKFCKEAIDESKKAVEDYRSGNEKSLNFIVGVVMRKTRGTASPQEVREIILRCLDDAGS